MLVKMSAAMPALGDDVSVGRVMQPSVLIPCEQSYVIISDSYQCRKDDHAKSHVQAVGL